MFSKEEQSMWHPLKTQNLEIDGALARHFPAFLLQIPLHIARILHRPIDAVCRLSQPRPDVESGDELVDGLTTLVAHIEPTAFLEFILRHHRAARDVVREGLVVEPRDVGPKKLDDLTLPPREAKGRRGSRRAPLERPNRFGKLEGGPRDQPRGRVTVHPNLAVRVQVRVVGLLDGGVQRRVVAAVVSFAIPPRGDNLVSILPIALRVLHVVEMCSVACSNRRGLAGVILHTLVGCAQDTTVAWRARVIARSTIFRVGGIYDHNTFGGVGCFECFKLSIQTCRSRCAAFVLWHLTVCRDGWSPPRGVGCIRPPVWIKRIRRNPWRGQASSVHDAIRRWRPTNHLSRCIHILVEGNIMNPRLTPCLFIQGFAIPHYSKLSKHKLKFSQRRCWNLLLISRLCPVHQCASRFGTYKTSESWCIRWDVGCWSPWRMSEDEIELQSSHLELPWKTTWNKWTSLDVVF